MNFFLPLNSLRRSWRQAFVFPALAFLSLCLLGWALAATWEAACDSSLAQACLAFWSSLIPLIVALGYWIAGLLLWWRQQSLRLEFFWVVAAVLAAGQLSTIPIDLGQRIFYALLSLLAPLVLHFHIRLFRRQPGFAERILLTKFYTTGTLLAMPFIIWPFAAIQAQNWYTLLWALVRIHLVIALLVMVVYLVWLYHSEKTPVEERRQVRRIMLGVCAALGPLVLFSLVPDTLDAPFHLPYNYSFLALLLLPATYVYSRLRYPFDIQEMAVDRSTAIYLLLLFIGVLGLVAATTLAYFVPHLPLTWLLISLFLVIFLLLASLPLQRLIHWLVHGSERELRQKITQMTKELALTLEEAKLQKLLTEQLVGLLNVAWVVLYRHESTHYLRLGELPPPLINLFPTTLPSDPTLFTLFARMTTPLDPRQLQEELRRSLTLNIHTSVVQLAGAPVTLWVPLLSASTLQGIIGIGPRRNGKSFSSNERMILATLAFQSAAAIHNSQLLATIQQNHQDLATAHRQLLMAREQERRQLASDLHDGAVQQLLGISYQVYVLQQQIATRSVDADSQWMLSSLKEMRRELLKLTSQLRLVMSDLHPASLESLGLGEALEEYLAGLQQQKAVELPYIQLQIDGANKSLPPLVAICLFRCVQEAVRNVLRHAQAQELRIWLATTADQVILKIHDDGKGFRARGHLRQLARHHHFGLLSMEGRVHALGGEFHIESQPGQGTSIRIAIPLSRQEIVERTVGKENTEDA